MKGISPALKSEEQQSSGGIFMKRRLVALCLGLAFFASFASADRGSDDRVWTVHPRPDARSIHPQFGPPPRSFEVAAVDPAEQKDLYISYWSRDIEQSGFHCFNRPEPLEAFKVRTLNNPVGTQLRTYRVAISATSAYTKFYGGTIPLVSSEIATMMNRVT